MRRESSIQPDGGEGLEKGHHREVGPERNVEQSGGPIDKKRITRPARLTSEQVIRLDERASDRNRKPFADTFLLPVIPISGTSESPANLSPGGLQSCPPHTMPGG